jgi:hypothetical protein
MSKMPKVPKMPKVMVSLRSVDFINIKRENALILGILVHFRQFRHFFEQLRFYIKIHLPQNAQKIFCPATPDNRILWKYLRPSSLPHFSAFFE